MKSKMTFKKAVNKVVKLKGLDSQYIALAEEAGELLVAASHRRRNRIGKEKFLEEMADVYMMIQEFLILEGISKAEFKAMYNTKLEKFYKQVREMEAEETALRFSIASLDTKQRKCNCCSRGDEYNGYPEKTIFTCPKHCSCHD